MPEPKILDQSECSALLDHLQSEAAFLRQQILKATGENIAAPKLTDDVIANVEAMQAHVATLRTKLTDLTPAQVSLSSAPTSAALPSSAPNPFPAGTLDAKCHDANEATRKKAKAKTERAAGI